MAEQKLDLHVEFFSDPVKHEAKSREAGRPVFVDAEFVRIRWPGDRNRELVAPAQQVSVRHPEDNRWMTYAERFPKHYEAFKQQTTFMGEGTPIEEAPFLLKSQVAELKAVNVHTIEILADLSESSLSKLGMGARKLMEQAKAYVEKAKDSAVETRLAAENADMRARIDALEAMIRNAGVGAPDPRSPTPVEPDETGPFANWSNEDLKAFIKDRSGAGPKGNPSRETLVRMAEELTPDAEAA